MKARARTLAAFLLLSSALPSCSGDTAGGALALDAGVRRLSAERSFWPGFDPLEVPLAVYDGESTYLFRHPSPPEGFERAGAAFLFPGRHPSVVANSSVTLGEVATATVMIPLLPDSLTLDERAAVVIHECFHVYQATTGRRWHANEVDLFVYPVEDADLLAMRRLETGALRMALSAAGTAGAASWAGYALELRTARFARMEPRFAEYERRIEVGEGTAAYVQHLAAAGAPERILPPGFEPQDVRNRAYRTGAALALLLDEIAPGWQEGFAGDDARFLDSDLAGALDTTRGVRDVSFTAARRERTERIARGDVAEYVEGKEAKRKEFMLRPGWRLVFRAAEGEPLRPMGFDPLNFERVEGGLLHTRYLIAGNDRGSLTVLGGSALTEGIGPHPLFDGISRITVAGIEEEPRVVADATRVMVKTPECEAEFEGGYFSGADSSIVITIGR